MSWGQWPGAPPVQQPPVVAAAAPLLNPAPSVLPPGMPYTSDQWTQMQQQNWQQWAQWQQQYQQWHQQYGAEYQKSINAMAAQQTVVTNMAVPPPLPVDPQPQPPLPKEEGPKPAPPLPVPVPPPQQPPMPSYTTQPLVPTHFNAPPPSYAPPNVSQPPWKTADQKRVLVGAEDSAAKRQMTNRQAWPNPAPAPPQNEELSEAEKKFDKQFAEWETQFNKWKEQNSGHPDKQQYKEYEKKWEQWRQQLLDRREAMRRKRLGLPPVKPQSQQPNNPPSVQASTTQFQPVKNPPPTNTNVFSKPPPDMNNEPLQFKGTDKEPEQPKDEGVGFLNTSKTDGIPGLDLVKDGDQIADDDHVPPPQRGPDLDAISKGINNILGDQKLMSMLSMVSQKHADASSNLSLEDVRKPEPIQNFDDQTRSSFTLQPSDSDCYRTPLSKSQFGNRGPPASFDENEMLYSRPPPNLAMPSVDDMKRPPPGAFGTKNLYDRAPPTSIDGYGPRGALLPDPDLKNDFRDRGIPGRDPQDFPMRARGSFNETDGFGTRNDAARGPGGFGPREGAFAPGRNSTGSFENRDGGPMQRFGRDGDDFNGPNFKGARDGPNFRDEQNFGGARDGPNFRGARDEPNFRGARTDFNDSQFRGSRDGPNFRGTRDEPNFRGARDDFNDPQFRGAREDFNDPQLRGAGDGPNFRGARDEVNQPNFRGAGDGPNFRGARDEINQPNFRDGPSFRGARDQFNETSFRGARDEIGQPNFRDGPSFRGARDQFNETNFRDGPNFGGARDGFNGDFRQNDGPYRAGDKGPEPPTLGGRFAGPKYGRGGFADDADYQPPPPPAIRGAFDAKMDAPEPPSFGGNNAMEEGGFEDPRPYVEAPVVEDIWKPATVVDYEHKRLKPPEIDILVQPFRMFDYRHKPLRRIPYPERPNWLSDSVKMIPEFDPPIIRPPPVERRPFDDRYDPLSQRRDDRNPYRPDERLKYERKGYEGRFSPPKYDEGDWPGRRRRSRSPPQMGGDRERADPWDRNPKRRWEEDDDFRTDRGFDRDRRERREEPEDVWKGRNPEWEDKRKWRDQDGEPQRDDRRDSRFRPDHREGFNRREVESVFPFNKPIDEGRAVNVTPIEELLNAPGRSSRPQRIVIILRGPPGSGKTHLAKMIKDKEVENGGSAPRILSLDDYFMVEQEREVVEDGKRIKLKEMVYEYEAEMEESYRNSLMKSFKKTITDGYFPFIIVDNVNDKVKYFGEMWSFAKQNGFQVYVCQLDLDLQNCTRRNTHNRTEEEIRLCIEGWETTPSHHSVLDATSLLQGEPIPEVEMEEINSPPNDIEDNDGSEDRLDRSKWDNFDCSINNLARLDGLSKPPRPSRTMEEFLQLDDDWEIARPTKQGQKRVRWADLEERKQQEKMRAIGFVVGQTDWDRMMDPMMGQGALTQTKYIEKVQRMRF